MVPLTFSNILLFAFTDSEHILSLKSSFSPRNLYVLTQHRIILHWSIGVMQSYLLLALFALLHVVFGCCTGPYMWGMDEDEYIGFVVVMVFIFVIIPIFIVVTVVLVVVFCCCKKKKAAAAGAAPRPVVAAQPGDPSPAVQPITPTPVAQPVMPPPAVQ